MKNKEIKVSNVLFNGSSIWFFRVFGCCFVVVLSTSSTSQTWYHLILLKSRVSRSYQIICGVKYWNLNHIERKIIYGNKDCVIMQNAWGIFIMLIWAALCHFLTYWVVYVYQFFHILISQFMINWGPTQSLLQCPHLN